MILTIKPWLIFCSFTLQQRFSKGRCHFIVFVVVTVCDMFSFIFKAAVVRVFMLSHTQIQNHKLRLIEQLVPVPANWDGVGQNESLVSAVCFSTQ